MEIYKDYERFKETCSSFKTAFTEKYLKEGGAYCHPLLDGVILTVCSAEEAKSNGVNICRMYDVMAMSDDGENFVPFNITKAREIAAQYEMVYITDLMGNGAFEAKNWMIDGKHDTIIISEEHMKKEGKPYAPVTPQTNVVVPLKKFTNYFLYKKGTVEEPGVLTSKDIADKIEAYIADKLADFPNLEIMGETEFEIFGKKVTADKNESSCAALDKALAAIDGMIKEMEPNKDIFNAAGYKFTVDDFIMDYLMSAAKKCSVTITAEQFKAQYLKDAPKDDIEFVKTAFRKLVSEKNTIGFKYKEAETAKFEEDLRAAEQSAADDEARKADICALLSVRPANAAVFNLARAASPADAENVEDIAEFWGKEPLAPAELGEYLAKSYFPADCRDEEGKLNCRYEKAIIIRDEINAAAAKYKLKNSPVLAEINEFCDEAEKQTRTYNGTVFETKEAMEKAAKNEAELSEKCTDLSALNEEELKKLSKYIYDMQLDKKTAGKYLLKIKLAMNDCEENTLKQLCAGLPVKTPAQLAEIKKKIADGNFDETLSARYIRQVDDAAVSAAAAELTAMFKGIETADKAKVSELEKKLSEGDWDKALKRHFGYKISDAKDGFAVKELADICKDLEKSDAKALEELRKKLDAADCRSALKNSYYKAIDARLDKLEKDEVTAAFAGIEKADKAKLDELENVIKSGKYRKSLTDGYTAKIAARRTEIENEAFVKKCETIPQMDKAALDAVTAELKSGKYPEDICRKYLEKADERALALVKQELAAMCKDIASMNAAQLDEIEKKLSDEKYKPELTSGYFDTIKARRKTLINAEADNLAKGIPTMQKDALAKLREQLSDKKFDQEYVKKHFDAITAREDALEKEKLDAMCKGMESKKKPELEKLSADLSASGCKKEIIAPYLEKVRALEIKLMKSEMENLCKNIPTTPRKELSKLREALSGDDFDKELSKKYIEQIDTRMKELIKTELADICKNLANSPKDKLLSMKMAINDVPEYAEQGKAYIEQIDSRLKQLDKAEFDKQMASIDKLDMEALEKFMEDLDKRKPTLDAAQYDSTLAKCKERGKTLETAELDKLCADLTGKDAAALNKIKETITEGDFTPEYTYPYIKKLDDAIQDYYVRYYSKLTENMGAMSKAELVALRESITENKDGCPQDMVTRYTGKINSKIREVDEAALSEKCKNLSTFTEHRSYELIKDINSMDIDDNSRRRYINQVELHITHIKTAERDGYVEQLKNVMAVNSITGVHFYVPGISKVFESQFVAITEGKDKFASIEQFELPVLIHEVTQGMTDEAFMLTVDYLYYRSRRGFDRIPVESIDHFEGKKPLVGKCSIVVHERDGKSNELPTGTVIDKKAIDNAVKVLNSIADVLKGAKSAAKIREIEEIKQAEEAKAREAEIERMAIEAAKKKGFDEEMIKAEAKPAEAPKAEAKPTEAPKAEVKPAEAPKAEAKPAEAPKAEVKPAEAPKTEAKPAEAPKTEAKPAEAPKAEVKPAEAPKAEAKPAEAPKAEAKPAEAPKTEAKPAEAPKAEAKPAEAPKAETKPTEAPKAETKPTEAPKQEIKNLKPIKPIEVVASPIPEVKPIKPIEAAKPAEAPKAEAKPAEAAKPKIRFCDQCGAKIANENAKFCYECGNKISR